VELNSGSREEADLRQRLAFVIEAKFTCTEEILLSAAILASACPMKRIN
jgi:hypothetical protein